MRHAHRVTSTLLGPSRTSAFFRAALPSLCASTLGRLLRNGLPYSLVMPARAETAGHRHHRRSPTIRVGHHPYPLFAAFLQIAGGFRRLVPAVASRVGKSDLATILV